jgi:hypothetical protein
LFAVRRAAAALPFAPLVPFAPVPVRPFFAPLPRAEPPCPAPSAVADMPVSEPVFFCRVEGVRAEVAMLGRLAEDQRRGVSPRRRAA